MPLVIAALLPLNYLHAIWSCPGLDSVWEASATWNFRKEVIFQNFRELMAWVIKNEKSPKLFAITIWAVRTQWNQLRKQQTCCSVSQLAQHAKDKFDEF